MDLTLRIFLIAITALIAISIGLLLRRWLIHRLKNTVLDGWIVETLGILIILPPLILAAAAALFILENGAFDTTWDSLMKILPVSPAQLIGLAWYFIETVLVIGLHQTQYGPLLASQGSADHHLSVAFLREQLPARAASRHLNNMATYPAKWIPKR